MPPELEIRRTCISISEDTDEEGKHPLLISGSLNDYPVTSLKSLLKSLTTTIDQYEQPQHPKAQKDAAHINKHAMHIVRLYYTAFDILEKGEIITHRDKEREELLAIRNDNNPRQFEDGIGYMSSESIKYKIRSYIRDKVLFDGLEKNSHALYCSPDTFSIERSVKECLEPIIGKKTKGIPDDQQLEAYKELCRYYYDTRMFGLVNTSYSNCSLLSRIKGACQVSMPMSYDPIEIIPMTITRCCVASDAERKGEDKGAKKGVSIDESDDGAEKKTKDRMIGRRSIIRYGLYHMSIQINSAMAQRNGVTMDDVNLLIDALQHMFEEDMSSSRALTLRKLFVVEHTKPMGNAYRDTIERALAARLKQPNDAPTSYEDYEVTYHREMLPDEVKVTEYNYNSQSV